MSDASAPDSIAIQKLMLRMAAAVSAGTPLELQPGETPEDVNEIIVATLNVVSRASRLAVVAAAARPLAERLSESLNGDVIHEFQVNQLVAALNALEAFDTRGSDYTIQD